MEFTFDLQMFADAAIVPGDEYQLRWGQNSEGLFEFKPTVTSETVGEDTTYTYTIKTSVGEQSTKTTFALPASGEKYYLKVENTYADGKNTLTIAGMYKVTSAGDITEFGEAEDTLVISPESLLTFTAPSTTPLVIDATGDKFHSCPATITGLAAGSNVTLKTGDKATTGNLAAGAEITIGATPVKSAGGSMTFIGETTGGGEPEEYTALYTGNVILTNGEGKLSGGNTIATTDTDGITVKVLNGKVNSITSLNPDEAGVSKTVTTTETTSEVSRGHTFYTKTVTTYTTMDKAGTMIERTVATYEYEDEEEVPAEPTTETTQYADLSKAGGELLNATYKDAQTYDIGGMGTVADKVAYLYVADVDAQAQAAALTADNTRSYDADTKKFAAKAGEYYIKVSTTTKAATTSKPQTTTITSVELMKSNAVGTLTKVTTPAYKGILAYDADGAAVEFAKKSTDKFSVNIADADIRSKFTNLSSTDSVTTANTVEDGLELSGTNTTYTVYNGTVSNTFTVKGKVTVEIEGGALTSITGLDGGENITITGITGLSKREVTATKSGSKVKITVTDTATDGLTKKYKDVLVDDPAALTAVNLADPDDIAALYGTTEASVSITNTFDWTANKNTTGYFVISGTGTSATATITTANNSITAANDGKQYIAASLNTTTNTITFSAWKVDKNNAALMVADSSFTGTLKITAPSTTINFGAKMGSETYEIKNLAAGSSVAFALAGKDSITTAKLNGDDDATTITDEKITIAGEEYIAGAKGTVLTIKKDGLQSGIVQLADTKDVTIGGRYTITNANEADTNSIVTVTATNGKFTSLGSLNDGDKVTITDNKGTTDNADDDVTYTFVRNGDYLYTADTPPKMFAVTAANVTGDALLKAANWKTGQAATGGITEVDLALADKAFKAETAPTAFVRDTYATAAIADTKKVAARVTTAVNATYDTSQGTIDDTSEDAATAAGFTHSYDAATAQTIKVTDGWYVATAAAGATIAGAASGKDYLKAGAGVDKISLNNAADIVDESTLGGKDEISGYASGKDKLIVANVADATQFVLSETNANDVYVTADGSITTNYALLKGVGGKAVSISKDAGATYSDYYFANGKSKTNSFTYAEGAHYIGNGADGATNTLKVGTDKTKATSTTAGDDVVIDLATSANYTKINVVDASSSANAVVLTAAADGSTLKGGTYKSQLISGEGADILYGGSGEDTFVLGAVAGEDTIKNYTVGKDKLTTAAAVTAEDFAVEGNNVILKGSTTIEGVVGKAITVNDNTVYVGKSGSANTFNVSGTPKAGDIFVGSEEAKDTIKVSSSIKELTITEVDNGDTVTYTAAKYQGGTMDMTTGAYKSIDVIDASGVKAAAAAISEYGSKFVKAHAGVSVKAGDDALTFTGSAFDDKYACGGGIDTIKYTANQGNDIITEFTVGDVIQLNGLTNTDIANLESISAGQKFTFANGGSLTITSNATLKYDAATKQIKAENNG